MLTELLLHMKYSSRCAIYWQLLHGWGVAWLNEIQLSMLWHACSILKEMPFNLSSFRKTEVDAMAKIDLLGLLFIRSRSLCLFHYKKKMKDGWKLIRKEKTRKDFPKWKSKLQLLATKADKNFLLLGCLAAKISRNALSSVLCQEIVPSLM